MLLTELQTRKELNPRYSLRAFARSLDIGASNLSRILNNGQELSLTMSRNIIKKLKFNKHDCLIFINSIAEEKKVRVIRLLSQGLDEEHKEAFITGTEWLTESVSDLMFVFDQKGRCVLFNKTAEQFLSRSLTGKSLADMGFPQEVVKKIKASLGDLYENLSPVKVEECFTIKDSEKCFEISLVPIMGREQKIQLIGCHWKDISERIKMERLLHLQEECGKILSARLPLHDTLKEFLETCTKQFAEAGLVFFNQNKKVVKAGSKDLLRENTDQALTPKMLSEPEFLGQLNVASLNIKKKKLETGCIARIPLSVLNESYGTLVLIKGNRCHEFCKVERELLMDLGRRLEDYIEREVLIEKCS